MGVALITGAYEEAGSGDLTAGADLKQTFFYDRRGRQQCGPRARAPGVTGQASLPLWAHREECGL